MEKAVDSAAASVRTLGLSWPLLVALLTLFGVLGVIRPDALLSDADSYWHLAAGRWIFDHAVVPTTDPFSHSMPGAAWTAQSWLSEVILAAMYGAGGWTALAALATICFALTLAILTRFLHAPAP